MWTQARCASRCRPRTAVRAEAIVPNLDTVYVLFVDDNEDARDIAKMGLEHQGAVVYVAPSAPEAMRMMSTVRPDVIVTDIMMPPMDGYEFLTELKRSPVWRDIPVIAVTGFRAANNELDARAAGFADFLLKPIDPTVMAAAIVRVIGPRADN
jgi:CheY-like chemotaxis protein